MSALALPAFIRRFLDWLPRTSTQPFCPTEIRQTVPVDPSQPWLTRFRRYAGIDFLVAVGYVDPGNWATDIEAGSRFGYELLCVVLASSLIAILLQVLCVRLGIGAGKDIATLCREQFPPVVNKILWAFAQLAIVACDFAEVLGTGLALKLLFGLPLIFGIALTALDTIIVLALQGKGVLRIEAIVTGLLCLIAGCFFVEIALAKPDWALVAQGFAPANFMDGDSRKILVAIGILGATVMPHNLYLHSSAVTTRQFEPRPECKRDAVRMLSLDTALTLILAFLVNAAILVLAASVFHFGGHKEVADIADAHALLSPLVGVTAAGVLFGVALFASGQSSTFTGTIAGQVVLQGFLNLHIPCWQQRVMTRMASVLPALALVAIMGEDSLGNLLVLSQVVLSLQLPFVVVPLLLFVRNRKLVGDCRINGFWAGVSWLCCAAIIGANLYMLANL